MFVQAHQAAIRKEMDAPLHSAPPPEHGIVTDPARRLILAYAAYVLMPDATWRAGQGQPAEHDHSGHGAAIVEIPEGAHTRRRTMGQARCPRCGEDELQRLWTCAVIAAEARYAAGTLHRDTPVEMASFVRPMPPIPEVTQDDIDAARVALIEAEPAAALSPLEQLAAQTRGPRPSAVW
jgi:Zn ribbon nucleic-acid-binding protein